MSGREHEDESASEADRQDRRADDRDVEADKADMSANLHTWLHDDDVAGAASDQRQAAARDRTAARGDRKAAATERARTDQDIDVEVRVDGPDGPIWCPGYLYRRDWEKRAGRWVCFVRYSTTRADGFPVNRNDIFDADDIRQVNGELSPAH